MPLTSTQIRLWNTRALADQVGGIARFADRVGRKQPQISNMIGRTPIKPIQTRLARAIEKACGKEEGWLDVANVRDWLGIRNQAWSVEVRAAMAAAGIRVNDTSTAGRDESELMTLYSVLPDFDRRRLVAIARVLASPSPGSKDGN